MSTASAWMAAITLILTACSPTADETWESEKARALKRPECRPYGDGYRCSYEQRR
jgi:hypothetical protein